METVRIEYADHRKDPGAWAKALGISKEAVDLYLASEVIDLHIDSFIWTRVFGYDLRKRHGHGLTGARGMYQLDIPRLREAQLSGGLWSITTNPFRGAQKRAKTFVRNIERLKAIFETVPDEIAVCRNIHEYRAARAAGKHAAMFSIQGGNALDWNLDAVDLIPDDLVIRITLVHLSTSTLGITSSPAAGKRR